MVEACLIHQNRKWNFSSYIALPENAAELGAALLKGIPDVRIRTALFSKVRCLSPGSISFELLDQSEVNVAGSADSFAILESLFLDIEDDRIDGVSDKRCGSAVLCWYSVVAFCKYVSILTMRLISIRS